MTTRATRISLRSDVIAKAGSLALAEVSDWLSGEWREAVAGDYGGLKLVLPGDSVNVQSAAIGNVVRFSDVYPDAGTDGAGRTVNITREFRIASLHDGAHLNTVEVTGVPMIYDLGKYFVSQVVGGVPMYNITVAALTPAQIWTTYIAPVLAANGVTWITAGPLNGDPLTLTWQRQTVLGLLQLLAQNTGMELSFARALDDSTYTVGLGTHVAVIDDTAPVAWVGRNVIALDRQIVSDQRHFTECVPAGVTPSGETEAPGIEQAVFTVASVAGDTLGITNPVSAYGAVGFDDQLNGLTVLTTIAPAPLHNIDTSGSSGMITNGCTYDSNLKRVLITSAKPSSAGQVIAYFGLTDGSSGQAAPITDMRGLAYASSMNGLWVADRSGSVKLLDPATFGLVATVAITGGPNPNKVRYIPGWDRIVVQHDNGFDVINPNTRANLGTIGSASLRDAVLYNATTNRVAVYSPTAAGFATLETYNATTLAGIGFPGMPAGCASTAVMTNGTAATNVYATGTDGAGNPVFWHWDWATFTVSAATPLGTLGAIAYAPLPHAESFYSSTSGRFYVVGATALYEITTAGVRTQNVPLNFDDTAVFAWHLEDAIDYLFLPDGAGRHVKILQAHAGGGVGSYQAATVNGAAGSSRVSNQQFDRVAGARGLTFVGQRIEFRNNAALDYVKAIAAPAAIATYGPIQGVAENTDFVGRRNYLRAGSADEWRADDVEKYLATQDESNAGQAYRWQSADEAPRVAGAGTVAALYASGATSLSLSGLGALTLSPGDVISFSAVTPFGANNYGIVAKRVVAAGGAATVTLWTGGINSGAAAGASVYIYKPSISSLGKLPTADLPVLYPAIRTNGHITAAFAAAPIVPLGSMSTAWAIAHVVVVSYGGAANAVALAAATDASGFATAEVSPQDAVAWNDGIAREYVLAQRVDLGTGATHVALRLRSTTAGLVVYVKSLMVIHGAVAVTDQSIPYSGGSMLWALGNVALLNATSPAITYTVTPVEDDVSSANALITLGREIRLRDPARGIAALPRIIEVTRYAVNAHARARLPVVTLATRQASLIDALVSLEV